MNRLKKFAQQVDTIPNGARLVEFVSPYPLESCVERIEAFNNPQKRRKMGSLYPWGAEVETVNADTVVFRATNRRGHRYAIYMNGILHRQPQDKTLVMIVNTVPRFGDYIAVAFLAFMLVMGIFFLLGAIAVNFGFVPTLISLVLSIVGVPFIIKWALSNLTSKNYAQKNSPVVARIREALGDSSPLPGE